MNPIVYNVCLLLGLAMFGVGAYLVWGLGPALVGVGSLVIWLTLLGAFIATRRKRG